MKGKALLAALVLMVGSLGEAQAGVPVIDVANLAQAIQQVLSWVTQKAQMLTQIDNQASQIKNQTTQIDRITGSRNLGQVFNNPLLQQAVPGNVGSVLSSVGTQGFSGLTSPAQVLRLASALYNCLERPVAVRGGCQAPLSVNAQAQAWQTSALTTVTQRVAEIQSMQQQINATTDPMAISQVQAALAAETAQVANDQNRIALMNAQVTIAANAAAQAETERNLAMMVPNAASFADDLVFP